MAGISKGFFRAEPGQIVRSGERIYRITHLLSVDSVLAEDVVSKESRRLRIEMVVPADADSSGAGAGGDLRDLALYSDEEWALAQSRLLAIKPLLENPLRSRSDAEKIATENKVHVATLYKWLKSYQEGGHVAALVPSKRGRKAGHFKLSTDQERLVESAIEDVYLSKQRHKAQDVIQEVFRRSHLSKIKAPHPNTVRNRIRALAEPVTLRRRGYKDLARNKFEPLQGKFPGANCPLAVVQIDHTEADIILVDEAHRKPIGRPWLTLAIDVYSRMIVGLYLTFERPSATSMGLCLAQAICPKREYLAGLGISGEWPVWGVMSVVHSDNGKEFKGAVLQRACDRHGIDLQWRPVLLPHFGGHIERLMGTMANEIRKLPGTTFSNIAQRKGYDSEGFAALTLPEFERYLVDFIVNVYHERLHSQLGMSPKKKWEIGVMGDKDSHGTGVMPIPEDPLRIRLDFMPFFERSVQRYGIQIDKINYYDSVLDPYINAPDLNNPKEKREFLVRRDPRDISKIYFLDPADDRYVEVPYSNIGHPPMSAWELKTVKQTLKSNGLKDINEHVIFEALERMRARVEDAKHKTKAARKQATRIPVKKPAIITTAVTEMVEPFQKSELLDDDPFASPIQPFDEVSLTR